MLIPFLGSKAWYSGSDAIRRIRMCQLRYPAKVCFRQTFGQLRPVFLVSSRRRSMLRHSRWVTPERQPIACKRNKYEGCRPHDVACQVVFLKVFDGLPRTPLDSKIFHRNTILPVKDRTIRIFNIKCTAVSAAQASLRLIEGTVSEKGRTDRNWPFFQTSF